MNYIKVNGDQVIIAGQVADEYMLSQGYIPFYGTIPPLSTNFSTHKFINNEIVEDIDIATLVTFTKKDIASKVSETLDLKAQEFRYDNMMSARSYAGFTNPFQTEALKLANWAASCWAVVGQIEQDVINNVRPLPTSTQVLLELPVYA